jgi:glycosyltransferase involved in cell wall biosynthesis
VVVKKMNILFYTPVNFRCRDFESLAIRYFERGHKCILLSQCEKGAMHESLESYGIATLSSNDRNKSLLKRMFNLWNICRKNHITLVFSHLEPTNFIAVISSYFFSAKLIIFRHHINEARLYGFENSYAYRLTYLLAKVIVVVSEAGRRYMIDEEKIPSHKIFHINLGYNFTLYEPPNLSEVSRIQLTYKSGMLLVFAARLTKYKRPDLVIELVREARRINLNVSVILLGTGEEHEHLKEMVNRYSLLQNVFFVGYVDNILDYLKSADMLVHPSVLESSCVVVKEASLVELPVIVCKGVGDFDEYLKHEYNSILVDENNFVKEALAHLNNFFDNPAPYRAMATKLKEEIVRRFSIENTFEQYQKFTNE